MRQFENLCPNLIFILFQFKLNYGRLKKDIRQVAPCYSQNKRF